MCLFQSLPNSLHGRHGKARIVLHETWPKFRWPGQRDTFGDGRCRAWVVGTLQCPGKPEQITRMHHPDNDLLAVFRHLRHLQSAVQKKKETARGSALFENCLPLGEAPRRRMLQQPIQLIVRHKVEKRNRSNKRAVDFQGGLFLGAKPVRSRS